MLRHEPGLKGTERRHAHEHEGVEGHHPAAQLIGHEGLQHRVGERGGDDHRAAREGQERQRDAERAGGGEQRQENAEGRAAVEQHRPFADAASRERESQGAEHGAHPYPRHQDAVAARVRV